MAVKQHSDVLDRAINSLEQLQKGTWYDAMQAQQDYPMMRVAMDRGKERSGNKMAFRIGVGSENEDGHAGLYEDYDVDRPDVMTKGTTEWTNHRKGFALDERELDPNDAAEAVIDDLEVLRNDMWVNTAEDIEGKAWQVPATSDKLLPFGIPYYIVWEDSSAGKFTASTPGSHTTIAGIDPAVQTKYQNYSITYVEDTRDDLGLRVGRGIRKTHFRPPMKVRGDEKVSHAIYTTLAMIEAIENIGALQNDQLGPDANPMFNKAMLARIRPTWVPMLDDYAAADSDPLYLCNHAFLHPVFKKGWKFRELAPEILPKQRTAFGVEVHSVYNWGCQLRNRQCVIAKAAPFGES